MCNFLVLFFLALEVLCECSAAQGRCGSVSTVEPAPCTVGCAGWLCSGSADLHSRGQSRDPAVRTACLMLPEHSKDIFPSWQVSAVLTSSNIFFHVYLEWNMHPEL